MEKRKSIQGKILPPYYAFPESKALKAPDSARKLHGGIQSFLCYFLFLLSQAHEGY